MFHLLEPGYFMNECQLWNALMTCIIEDHIRESGGSNKATVVVLFCLAQCEDNYNEYIHQTEKDEHNTFETLLNQLYGGEEAEDDLKNTFQELSINDKTQTYGFQ